MTLLAGSWKDAQSASAVTSLKNLLPGGPAYRAVIVDGMSALSAESAERLLAVARAGVPVVIKGDAPARGVSFRTAPAEDAQCQVDFGRRPFEALSQHRSVAGV